MMKSPGATNTGAFARTLIVTADLQTVPQEPSTFNEKVNEADLFRGSPPARDDASESSTFVHIAAAAYPILQRHWGALK